MIRRDPVLGVLLDEAADSERAGRTPESWEDNALGLVWKRRDFNKQKLGEGVCSQNMWCRESVAQPGQHKEMSLDHSQLLWEALFAAFGQRVSRQ